MGASVEAIYFQDIVEIWQNHLWPGRVSPITPVSGIDVDGSINGEIFKATPFFWGIRKNQKFTAVSSGFSTSPEHFRIRGTWVHEDYRGQGLGNKLLIHIAKEATTKNAKILWTMPRLDSWPFYEKFGFRISCEVTQYEFGPHYIAEKKL